MVFRPFVRVAHSSSRVAPLGLALGLVAACSNAGGDDPADSAGESLTTLSGDGDGDTDTDSSGDGDGDGGEKLDALAGETDGIPCEEDDDCGQCEAPEHIACDQGTNDPVKAMGLNCPGDPQVDVSVNQGGNAAAVGVRTSLGNTNAFDPTEGSAYAVIGSGLVAELDLPGDTGPTNCNDDLDGDGVFDPGPLDPGATLPAPIVPINVGGTGCADNPDLVGNGDCSNTIQEQFDQGGSAHDWTEIRIVAQVPEGVSSFSYDFAFFSTEYPDYFGSQYNDMYIAWLESEVWTGNISFDEQGNPISLNAGFLDYKDSTFGTFNDPECMNGCDAPELHGSCMEEHAGTKWLSTSASVSPGEEFTLVLAIFDLSDSILDSYTIIDNFVWGCDGDQPPSTVPID